MSAIYVDYSQSADADGIAAFRLDNTASTALTGTNSSFVSDIICRGVAGDVSGSFRGGLTLEASVASGANLFAAIAINAGAAAFKQGLVIVDTPSVADIAFWDHAAIIETVATAAGAGPALTIRTDAGTTSGAGGAMNQTTGAGTVAGAGGAWTVTTGNGAGAAGAGGTVLFVIGAGGTNAADDGKFLVRLNDQATTGAGAQFVVENDDSTVKFMEIDLERTLTAPSAKSTFAGIKVQGVARPFFTLAKLTPLDALTNAATPAAATVTYNAGAANNLNQYRALEYADAATTVFQWWTQVDDAYDDTSGTAPDIIIEILFIPMTTNITAAQTVRWQYAITGLAHDEAVSGAVSLTTDDYTQSGTGTAGRVYRHRITVSAPNIDASDLLNIRIARDGTADTYNDAIRLVSAKVIGRADRLS